MEPKNKQMYDWRFTDGRGVINNKRFQADSKVGTLTIFKPDNDTDGYYKCNIVMPDESIVAYRHTVLSALVVALYEYYVHIYTHPYTHGEIN